LLLVRGNSQDDALAELKLATTLAPENARFAYVYAVALNSMGMADRAVVAMQDAANRFPADFDVRWALVSLLREQGQLDAARTAAEEMSEQFPEVESVQVLLRSL
jgi:predicted Zn-dependent protease